MIGHFEAIQRNKILIHAQTCVTLHVVNFVVHDMSPVIKHDRV